MPANFADQSPYTKTWLALIERFVKRQAIVLAAMEELRPDLVMVARGKGDKPIREFLMEVQRLRKENFEGDWGGEWHYFMHGFGGCLTHKVTHEPIEWDAADVNIFDSFWFINYVAWLFAESEDESALTLKSNFQAQDKNLENFVFENLSLLETAGLISCVVHGGSTVTKYLYSVS